MVVVVLAVVVSSAAVIVAIGTIAAKSPLMMIQLLFCLVAGNLSSNGQEGEREIEIEIEIEKKIL